MLLLNNNSIDMKQTLKLLIDILFILHLVGVVGFFLILPFGIFSTNIADAHYDSLYDLPTYYWIGIVLSITTYIIFLFGLFFLRQAAGYLQSNSFFKDLVIRNILKSGYYFITSGIVLSLTYLFMWVATFNSENIKISYGTNLILPLFLGIIGVFFVLLSSALYEGEYLKEDNELTI